MPAAGITDGPPIYVHDHQAVVLSCSHLARRWAVLECCWAWLFVNTQGMFRVLAGDLNIWTQDLSITHIYATVFVTVTCNTTHHYRLWGCTVCLADLKCVKWDIKPYYTIPYHTIPATVPQNCDTALFLSFCSLHRLTDISLWKLVNSSQLWIYRN